MKDCSQPATMKNPNQMVIHIGTDDLPARKQTDTIAKDIAEIELTCDVSILNTVLRKEQYTKKKDLCKKSCTGNTSKDSLTIVPGLNDNYRVYMIGKTNR